MTNAPFLTLLSTCSDTSASLQATIPLPVSSTVLLVSVEQPCRRHRSLTLQSVRWRALPTRPKSAVVTTRWTCTISSALVQLPRSRRLATTTMVFSLDSRKRFLRSLGTGYVIALTRTSCSPVVYAHTFSVRVVHSTFRRMRTDSIGHFSLVNFDLTGVDS